MLVDPLTESRARTEGGLPFFARMRLGPQSLHVEKRSRATPVFICFHFNFNPIHICCGERELVL